MSDDDQVLQDGGPRFVIVGERDATDWRIFAGFAGGVLVVVFAGLGIARFVDWASAGMEKWTRTYFSKAVADCPQADVIVAEYDQCLADKGEGIACKTMEAVTTECLVERLIELDQVAPALPNTREKDAEPADPGITT